MISADTSKGNGGDYDAFHVWDVDTLQQVAQYQGYMDTRRYATLLQTIGRQYNNALLVVQVNNTGQAVVGFILEDGYPNLYYDAKVDSTMSVNQKIRKLLKSSQHQPGFMTTNKSRPLIIEQMRRMIQDKQVIFYSSRTIQQLRTFI